MIRPQRQRGAHLTLVARAIVVAGYIVLVIADVVAAVRRGS